MQFLLLQAVLLPLLLSPVAYYLGRKSGPTAAALFSFGLLLYCTILVIVPVLSGSYEEHYKWTQLFGEFGLLLDGLASPAPPIPDLKPGLEGIKQAFKVFASAYPDGTHVIHDLIAEGDRVVVRVSGTGTQTGEFKGIKPTGKKVEMTGIVIYRFDGGKIVERWAQHNFLGFVMQQLGVVSPHGHESKPSS